MTVNTTWTSPVSATLDKTTGGTIDETMTDAIASNFYHLGGASGHIGARVYHTATQSLTTGVAAALVFNSERYDLDPNAAIHDTSSNTSRLVCRTAGKYLIGASVRFATNATGLRALDILFNGATIIAVAAQAAFAGAQVDMTISTVYDLAAGQYVEVRGYQTSGGALNVEAAGDYTPEFWMAKV